MAEFFVEAVFKITGLGPVPVGRVVNGVLRPGMTLSLEGKTVRIKGIEKRHAMAPEAVEGDSVGLHLENGDLNALKRCERKTIQFS